MVQIAKYVAVILVVVGCVLFFVGQHIITNTSSEKLGFKMSMAGVTGGFIGLISFVGVLFIQ